MDQGELSTSLVANLEAFSDLTTALFALSVLTLWSTLKFSKTLQFLSIEVSPKHSYLFFSFLFASLMIGMAIYLHRIDRMLPLLAIEEIPQATTALLLNESIANPYAFFGDDATIDAIADGIGPASVVLTMWCGIITLYLMKARTGEMQKSAMSFPGRILGMACIAISAPTMVLMLTSGITLVETVAKWSPDFASQITASMRLRAYITLAPAAVGIVIVLLLPWILSWIQSGRSEQKHELDA